MLNMFSSHSMLKKFKQSCKTSNKTYIQLRKMNIIPLVNKPYVNEVTLNGQNLYQKSC